MSKHWLSSKSMTVVVEVQYNRIVDAPPIVKKFIGQPLDNLIRWMEPQGGLRRWDYKEKE